MHVHAFPLKVYMVDLTAWTLRLSGSNSVWRGRRSFASALEGLCRCVFSICELWHVLPRVLFLILQTGTNLMWMWWTFPRWNFESIYHPHSVQPCWNFAMGSVLARLFRPDPQEVRIRLSKLVLDRCFHLVQLSAKDVLIRQLVSTSTLRKIQLCHQKLNFVAKFKLFLLLSRSAKLAAIVEETFESLGGRKEAWNFCRVKCETFLVWPEPFPCSRLWEPWSEFSEYRRWIPKESLVETVASGQQMRAAPRLWTIWSPNFVWQGWCQTLQIHQCRLWFPEEPGVEQNWWRMTFVLSCCGWLCLETMWKLWCIKLWSQDGTSERLSQKWHTWVNTKFAFLQVSTFATYFQCFNLSSSRNYSYVICMIVTLRSTDHCWIQAALARLGVERKGSRQGSLWWCPRSQTGLCSEWDVRVNFGC